MSRLQKPQRVLSEMGYEAGLVLEQMRLLLAGLSASDLVMR